MMQKVLVIQTAFIGDVVLSSALLESLHAKYPTSKIDVLVRKGNEGLFEQHPFLNNVLIWDKKINKYRHWLQILRKIRSNKYDVVINVQRYLATGLWTAFSKAITTIGFDNNPMSFMFTHKVKRISSDISLHEIDKNHALLEPLTKMPLIKPKLYPNIAAIQKVIAFQQIPYICMAPASVWFTKQFPINQWIHLINYIPFVGPIYLLGGPGDKALCQTILDGVDSTKKQQVVNLAGTLHFLESAALQQLAVLNYVNDSAPMHFASAVNAPVVAIYCSTVPDFGYGPLSDKSFIVETNTKLDCRPCGMHGKKECPLKHFNCAQQIQLQQLVDPLKEMAQD